jgi:hypothetical protein
MGVVFGSWYPRFSLNLVVYPSDTLWASSDETGCYSGIVPANMRGSLTLLISGRQVRMQLGKRDLPEA